MLCPKWSRLLGIACGLGTHALFGWTVWNLFFFLRDGGSIAAGLFPGQNSLLALQFAVIHSLLLLPTVQARLKRWIPSAFYGCFFCFSTCVTLLLVFAFWVPDSRVVYEFHGWAAAVIRGGFLLAWLALFYSLSLSGLGYQTGWTPWWAWFRNRPLPRREFQARDLWLVSAPELSQFSGVDLAHAENDAGSCRPDGLVDHLHLPGQLSQG